MQGTVHGNIQFWALGIMCLVCTSRYIMMKVDVCVCVCVTLKGVLSTSARELGVKESIWTKTVEVLIA